MSLNEKRATPQTTPALTDPPFGGPPYGFARRSHPYRQPAAPGQATARIPTGKCAATAALALEHVTVSHKSPATSSNRYINGRSARCAGTDDQAPEPANIRRSARSRARYRGDPSVTSAGRRQRTHSRRSAVGGDWSSPSESRSRMVDLSADQITYQDRSACSKLLWHVHSFRATSGPVIRVRRGNVEAMIASDATSPPTTVTQYVIPGIRNAMSTCEWR